MANIIGWAIKHSQCFVILLLSGLLTTHGLAQPRQLGLTQLRQQDSLRQLVQAASSFDTAYVNHLNSLALALRTDDPPQASGLFHTALKLARGLGYRPGIGHAQFGLGYCYRAANAYDSALYFTQQAIRTYTILGDSINKARGLYNLSGIYYEQGDYGQALAVNMDGLALTQARHDRKGQLFQLTQLGLTSTALGEYPAARQYLAQALDLAQTLHDAVGIGHAYGGLGDLNRAQAHWSLAGHYYAQAGASYRHVYNAIGMLPIELDMAEMMERQGGHDAALAAATRLLGRAQAAGTQGQLARAQLLLASVFNSLGRADSARRYAALSLAINRRKGLKQQARDAASMLAQASAQLALWPDAYRYQYLTGAYTDSLANEEARRRAAAFQLAYARSQQQSQIRLLVQHARLQAQQQELERLRARQEVAGMAALALLVLVLSGGLLWRYRRREASRLAALRTRIAADLHDEVGSMLTQISMQSTLLREGFYAPDQQQVYLDQMSEASRRAARQMNDAVWSIDARYDSAASLLDRLRDHAHEVLPPAGIELDFWVEPTLGGAVVPLATRQALYFIYKEALHNVVKHAQAHQVHVRLRVVGRRLELEVRDDGRGMSKTNRSSGQGLPNMRMRATAVGGALSFSDTRPGVSILAQLPLR